MTNLDRRSFVHRALRVGGGAVLAPSLAGLAACNADSLQGAGGATFQQARKVGKGFGGYGPLAESPDCPEVLIPDGFKVVKLSITRQPSLANSGFIVPIALDGMATFRGSGHDVMRLVRNHEVRDPVASTTLLAPTNAYDTLAGAGTTTLEVRVHRAGNKLEIGELELAKEFVSLNGTAVNCAGGPTPWGSWLSCEETTEGIGAGRLQPHGYTFDVPASLDGIVTPVAFKALGRFVKEAMAVDPRTGIVYQTEDFGFDPDDPDARPGSGFYRFVPATSGDLSEGRLQVLAVSGQPNYNTATGQIPGRILPTRWVDISDPDPANAEDDPSAVFRQGLAGGAAIFQRLEGCWHRDGSVFFNATSGGDAGEGQVWQFRQLGADKGQLILVFESPSADVLESPDNITVSPRGGIVLCEDGGGVQFLRGLTRRGEIFDFVETNGDSTEFAGACYSPDGEILFFNIQGATRASSADVGFTFAMWGPWEQGAL